MSPEKSFKSIDIHLIFGAKHERLPLFLSSHVPLALTILYPVPIFWRWEKEVERRDELKAETIGAVWLFERLILLQQRRDAISYYQTLQRGEDLSHPLPFSFSDLPPSRSVFPLTACFFSLLLPSSLWHKNPKFLQSLCLKLAVSCLHRPQFLFWCLSCLFFF